MKTTRLPQIFVFNRQRKIALDRAELKRSPDVRCPSVRARKALA